VGLNASYHTESETALNDPDNQEDATLSLKNLKRHLLTRTLSGKKSDFSTNRSQFFDGKHLSSKMKITLLVYPKSLSARAFPRRIPEPWLASWADLLVLVVCNARLSGEVDAVPETTIIDVLETSSPPSEYFSLILKQK
jgi:hypothetical protein